MPAPPKPEVPCPGQQAAILGLGPAAARSKYCPLLSEAEAPGPRVGCSAACLPDGRRGTGLPRDII
eukprot:6620482-Alexandrium_andersonii.AAC.1